jgi:hypothetical protein
MIVLIEMGLASQLKSIFSEKADLLKLAGETQEKMKVVKWDCRIA